MFINYWGGWESISYIEIFQEKQNLLKSVSFVLFLPKADG